MEVAMKSSAAHSAQVTDAQSARAAKVRSWVVRVGGAAKQVFNKINPSAPPQSKVPVADADLRTPSETSSVDLNARLAALKEPFQQKDPQSTESFTDVKLLTDLEKQTLHPLDQQYLCLIRGKDLLAKKGALTPEIQNQISAKKRDLYKRALAEWQTAAEQSLLDAPVFSVMSDPECLVEPEQSLLTSALSEKEIVAQQSVSVVVPDKIEGENLGSAISITDPDEYIDTLLDNCWKNRPALLKAVEEHVGFIKNNSFANLPLEKQKEMAWRFLHTICLRLNVRNATCQKSLQSFLEAYQTRHPEIFTHLQEKWSAQSTLHKLFMAWSIKSFNKLEYRALFVATNFIGGYFLGHAISLPFYYYYTRQNVEVVNKAFETVEQKKV